MMYDQKLQQALLQTAGPATDEVLVAADSARRIRVAHVYIMSDTALTVTLESGTTTRLWEAYPAANGGVEARAGSGQYLFETAVGEALTVTTSAGGNVFVSALYGKG